MKKLLLWIIAACPMFAQNIVGTWQGSLQPPQGKPLCIVFKISRADDESLKSTLDSLDQGSPSILRYGSAGLHAQNHDRRGRRRLRRQTEF
jgi:hypothetical protein